MDIPCTLFIHRQTFGLSLGAYDRQCYISTHINFHVDINIYIYICLCIYKDLFTMCVCIRMHTPKEYVCAPQVCSAQGGQKGALNSWN